MLAMYKFDNVPGGEFNAAPNSSGPPRTAFHSEIRPYVRDLTDQLRQVTYTSSCDDRNVRGRAALDELKSESQLLFLEQQIDVVEKRLNMLRDQIVAMTSEDGGAGSPSELLFTTRRVLRSLKLLRLEMLEDTGKPVSRDSTG